VESTAHWITGKVNDGLVPYAVIDLHAERAVGLVSYMAIERAMGTVEIGHVTWSRAMKNTPLGTEAVWLLPALPRLSSAGVEVRFDECRLAPRRRPAGVYLGRASAAEAGAQRTHPRQRYAVDYR
jgi:hypothetical protein